MIMSRVQAFTDRPDLLMAVMDKSGNLLWTNSAFASFGDYAIDEAIAQNLWQILSSYTSRQDLIPYIHEQISKGEGFRFEASYFKPSNQEVLRSHFLIDGQPIYNPDGNIQEYTLLGTDITSQKKAEADLVKESELRESASLITATEELQVFFDSALDLLCVVDLDNKFLKASKSWERLLGYSTDELVNCSFQDFIHPDDLQSTHETMQKLAKGENVFSFVNRYRSKEGSYHYLEWTSTVKNSKIYATARNVSDRHFTEIALNQSEAKQKAIISALPDLVMVVNSDGIYTEFISTDLFKVVEKSKNHIGLGVDETIPLPLAQRRLDAVRKVLRSGSMEIYEQEILFDGVAQIEEVRVVPYQDHEVLILVRDISDRKRVEEELRQSEEKFRKSFESADIGISFVAADNRFLGVNPAFCQMLGYSEAELLGLTFSEITYGEDAAKDLALNQKLLNGEIPSFALEKRYIHKNGDLIWVSLNVSYIFDTNQRPLYNVAITQNISDRKIAELNLQSSEARTRSILGAIPDIINMYSSDGIFLESVGAYNSRDFVIDYSNSVGKHITELLPYDIALAQYSGIYNAATSGQSQIIEQQFEIDGRIQDEEVRIVPTQDGNALVIVRDISEQQAALRERKIAEAALLKSESENRAILAAIPDLIFQVSSEGIYLKRFSTNFVKDAIVPDQDPVGKSIVEVLPPNIAELKKYHLQIALETGETQIYEQELQIGGKLQYEEVRIVKISDRSALTMIRDITEQQAAMRELIQAEAQLRQSEETNRAILAAIPDLLLRVGRDLTCYDCIFPKNNQAALFIPVINNMIEVLPPNLFDFMSQQFEKAVATGKLQVWEHQILKYGKPYDEEVRLVPCGKDQCLVIVRDISDRKRAEIANRESSIKLAETNAELNALFSAMTDLVLVRNSAGQCLKVAPTNSFSTLLGTSDEVIGKPILEELPEEQANIILGAIAQALETGKTIYRDYKLVIQDREVWFSASISPITADTVMQISRDITERKQAEIALSIAKEEAEALAKAKSDFLANMSHEIRTPMNAVLGMAQLLSSTTLTAEQLDFVQTILDSGDGLLSIINDILDFSKIESGTLELESQEFILKDILASTFKILSGQATNKNIHLASITQSDLPIHFKGDSSRLRQILLNLVGNAIKFAEQGEVKVMVSGDVVHKDEQNKHQLCFQVIDSGIGIESDRILKLFQPFTQADASISRKYGGTGLGLAICKRLVGLMGGTIWVESFGKIGGHPPLNWSSNGITEGSSFYFTVGLEISAAIANQKAVPSQELGLNQKLAELFPLRILLAEDNPVNQKVACFMLKKLGYKVDVANNGLEALRAVQSGNYDLVFMDLQMPEMDGLTATKMLRQLNPNYPWIVAMTANSLPEDRQICLDAGMNDYISKPINIQELMRVLSSCDRNDC